jgi:N-methylhydantoinase B/oxoprolinase/acetone carboxylase alpha subunit
MREVKENARGPADMVGDLVADMAACAAPERDVLRS